MTSNIEFVNKLALSKPKVFSKILKSQYFDIYNEIQRINSKTFSEKAYIYVNGYSKCGNCNHSPRYISFVNGYGIACSNKCAGKINSNNKSITKKRSNTIKERYGVNNVMNNAEVLETYKKTLILKYGVDNLSKSDNIQDVKRQNNIKKYGVSHWMKLDSYKQKSVEYNQERYAVDNISQRHLSKDTLAILNDIEQLTLMYKELKSCDAIADKLQVSPTTIHVRLRSENIFNKGGGLSYAQRTVYDFIKSIIPNEEILYNDRKIISPKELDIVIPSKKIAIEFCGLYWHSISCIKDKNYHKNKMKLANNAGYRLITIFGDEWFKKRVICEDRLRSILSVNNPISVRKTIIKEINNKEASEFINSTHVQGYVPSNIKLGAYYNDELVAAMTFIKARKGVEHSNDEHYELLRFSSKGNIVGMANKFFKYAIKNYKMPTIVTFADLRWNTGIVYEKMGFTKIHETGVNFWYVDQYKKRYHRFTFRKDKQIMDDHGFDKIYDCGSNKYIWKEI